MQKVCAKKLFFFSRKETFLSLVYSEGREWKIELSEFSLANVLKVTVTSLAN